MRGPAPGRLPLEPGPPGRPVYPLDPPGRVAPGAARRPPAPGGGGMGLPVTDRGGPPGGGGIGRPEALVGGRAGADEGGVGPPPTGAGGRCAAGAAGAAATRGAAGAAVGAATTRAAGAAAGAAGASAAVGAGAGLGVGGAWVAGATGGPRGAVGAGADVGAAAGAAGIGADGAREGGGAAGCSEAGRLVISLVPERLIGGVDGASGPAPAGLPASAAGSANVLGADSAVPPTSRAGAALFAPAVFVAASFLAGGAGSSGCTGRRRPSRSAFRRARSAWASSMDDEWLFTPIPRDRQRSSASLLVRPSS